MRNVRLLMLTLLLIIAVTLSACTVALPGAVASLGSHLLARSASAQAEATATPASIPSAQSAGLSDLQSTLEQIYQAVNPSVVNIQVWSKLEVQMSEIPEMLPQFTQGLGSGFVWDKQGHIVTNNHVVDGAERITVIFYDGLTLPAEIVGRDPDSDLAVIKVDPSKVDLRPVAVTDSTRVKVGQFVVAIGNPFGLEGTMTFGIVSALGRTLPAGGETTLPDRPAYSIPDIIQTDAPVNPGNSGGVLLDLQGQVIGVPSAIESPVLGSAGVGFAVPSAIVQRVVPTLIETGRFEHPWIGISGGTITSEVAKAMNLPETQRGALVSGVTAGSPADEAGLRGSTEQVTIDGQEVPVGGDLITAIDGRPVKRFEDLTAYLARYTTVGQTVKLTVLRDGKETAISLKLAARPQPEGIGPAEISKETGGAWLGINGITLTPELAGIMNLSADQKGVLVQNVVNGSPADQADLQGSYKTRTLDGQRVMVGGDVIVAVDGKPVETIEELSRVIRSMKPDQTVTLAILRDGEKVEVSVKLAAQPTQTP